MKIFQVFLLFLLCCITLQTETLADFEKTKIAVLDFRLQGNDFDTEDMGKIVAEWLITAFVREGRFEVVERKLLGEVLEEQKMIETGIVDQDTASEIGKLLGVKVIISGSVAKIQDVVEVNARIVDVTSASIITAESVSNRDITSLRQLVREMASKIMKNFPLEGYIAKRNNNDIVIDLGRQSGVKPGMTFLVYREGDVVKHPKTGEIIYVSQIEIGTIKIDSVQDKIATGTILNEMEKGGISYGDLIKSSTNESLERLPKSSSSGAVAVAESVEEDQFFETAPAQTLAPPEQQAYAAKGPASEGSNVDDPPGRLFVNTIPSDARVRILNIGPRYSLGMLLPADSYHVEVSAAGFQTKSGWYELEPGEEKSISVVLSAQTKHSATASNSTFKKYFSELLSEDSKQVQQSAKYLYRKYRNDQEVIDTASTVLAKRYHERPNDRTFVDGMAYLCNILGVSGQSSHKTLLSEITEQSKSRKLRSFAAKNLKRLST